MHNSSFHEHHVSLSFGLYKPPQFQITNTEKSPRLTIEEFLTRYPEVKRLSSRFGDDDPNTESPFKSHKKSHNKNHNKNKKNKQGNKNRPSSPPPQKSFTA